MSEELEVVVRIASSNDFKNLDKLLASQDEKPGRGLAGFNRSSFQSLLLQESHLKVFVVEKEAKIIGMAIVCVVDAGSTIVHRNISMFDDSPETSITTSLLKDVYMSMESTFPRLRRERFVSSSSETMTQILLGKGKYHKISEVMKKKRGPFNEAFELYRKYIEVPSGISFGRILDKLARESTLVLLSKRQAGKYILENVSSFKCRTIIMDDVPYYLELSDSNAFLEDTECLFGERGSESKESNMNFQLQVPDQEQTSSGRNSPSRRSSSHLISVLDSLHTSLRCMNETLRGLQDTLLASMPKSFSHGRQISNSSSRPNSWETTIYSDDPKMFRAHIIEQLRVAVLRVKGRFVFKLSFNGNLSNVAVKVLKNELGLKILKDTMDRVVVYERSIYTPLESEVKD